MGWKTIHGRQYYYTSERDGPRITTTYYGAGRLAASVATLDAIDRAERQTQRDAQRVKRERDDAAERDIADWFDQVEALAHAALVAAGYHRHKRGEWRKSRGDRSPA